MTYLTSTHVWRKRPMAGNQRGSVSISDTWASDTWAADTWAADTWTRVRAGCSAEAGP
jgi:hypothetical protein